MTKSHTGFGRLLIFLGLLLPVIAMAQAPVIDAGGAVDAAAYSAVSAEGGLISIFGTNLADAEEIAPSLPLPTQLGGASVEIINDGSTLVAPLIYASPGQINAQLPYGLTGDSVQVRVVTGAGTSNAQDLPLIERAPSIFTFTQTGAGRVVAIAENGELVTGNTPIHPGNFVSLFLTGLGSVEPAIAAGLPGGDGTSGQPYNMVPESADTRVYVGGTESPLVQYVGLAPYYAGLYQINFRMPYSDLAGDQVLDVEAGAAITGSTSFIPTTPNGFYITLPASKAPNGQTLTGVDGPDSAIAFSHLGGAGSPGADLGDNGLQAWSKDTGVPDTFDPITGLALTLVDGETIVYDNNGIEDGTHGGFYDNEGGGPDAEKPGLLTFYSNSVRDAFVTAGYFRLENDTTITKIIGYFDGLGQLTVAPFDPENFYNTYRMNIYTNHPDNIPGVWVDGFLGDVLSSDQRAPAFVSGTFAFSDTELQRVFQGGAVKPIFRLEYELDQAFTLPAGEYWFSHDVATPEIASPQVLAESKDEPQGPKARRTSVSGRDLREVHAPAAFTTGQ